MFFFFIKGEDYVWGTGKVGVHCEGEFFQYIQLNFYNQFYTLKKFTLRWFASHIDR